MTTPLDVRIIADLSPTDWWTVGLTGAATLLGAVIGAGIAYLVARQSAAENRNQIEARRRDREETATLRTEVKIIELMNAAAGYHLQMERYIEESKKQLGEFVELWRAMRSFVGRAKEISIESDDLIAFIRAREFTYLSQILFLASRYNAMIDGVEAYGSRRDQLMEMITPVAMKGLVGSIEVNEQEMRRLRPYIATVQDLAEQTRTNVTEVFEMAKKVTAEFGPIVRRYFNDPKFPVPGIAPEFSESPQEASKA